MALRHMAWFKDGVTSERIEEHLRACRSVVGRVPVPVAEALLEV